LKSVTTDKFRKSFAKLPKNIQERARRSYQLWKLNNNHPGLHFKQIHNHQPIYSVVDALKDEWVIERKVQLLIDKEEIQQAKNLLLSAPFQKVHQTYTRTGLWMQICEKLKVPCLPIPKELGEDQLARFGAYREYE